MILVLDNRDSFVHNLARYVRLAGVDTEVIRSTEVTVEEVLATLVPHSVGKSKIRDSKTARLSRQDYMGVVLSPGPGRPEDAGICIDLIRAAPDLPIYGVCLGHQCLADAYGGQTLRSGEPTHGRASEVQHAGDEMFAGVPSPFEVGRYHSLTVEVDPRQLLVTARTARGEIMAMRHVLRPHWGVQFHPESLLTPTGQQMINTFVALCRSRMRSASGAME